MISFFIFIILGQFFNASVIILKLCKLHLHRILLNIALIYADAMHI